jgi:hypothetical protein
MNSIAYYYFIASLACREKEEEGKLENIIDKLQKMLNHERSARSIGNTHEAEAFAAKIADMLFTHKLSMSEVEMEQEERNEPVSSERVEGFKAPWAEVLASGVSQASFCKVLSGHKSYIFIGRPSDRSTAISMYRYLATLGKSICDAELAKYKDSEEFAYELAFSPRIGRTWSVSFLRGYANAIYYRLIAERKNLTSQAQSSGTSLVYIDKSKAAIDAFVTEKYGKLGSSRSSSSRVHSGAYGAGKLAGSRVSIKAQGQLSA